jgi:hypothetical protein
VSAIDELGALIDGGPIEPLTHHDVAALLTRIHDQAIPDDATVPHRFNGLNVITFETVHYGVANQIGRALGAYRLRPTEIRKVRWELPTEVNGKLAVIRVEFVDTKPWPAAASIWNTEEGAA